MTSRFTFTVVGTAILALATGLGVGFLSRPTAADPDKFVARALHEDLEQRHGRLEERYRNLKSQQRSTTARNKELGETIASLGKDLESYRAAEAAAAAAKEAEAEANAAKLPIAFGKWTELEGIKNAKWSEMGGAVATINELVLELMESLEAGEPVDAAVRKKIQEENSKLVFYAAQLMGKIPTHSPVNGEFSHPITSANLMSAMLEQAGAPLTESQQAEFVRLGESYERSYEQRQTTYTEETPGLEKLIDELEFKRDTINAMQDFLTDEQRDWVVHPEIHHRMQMDTLSPATMAIMLVKPRWVNSADALRETLPKYLAKQLRVEGDQVESLDSVIDVWMEDLAPLLEPREKHEQFLHIDEAITAGRAHANMLKELMSSPGLDDKAREAIRNELSWGVPQVVPETEDKSRG